MKDLMRKSVAMMAITLSSCTSLDSYAEEGYEGRVIEFKSGSEGFDTRTFFYEGQNEVVAFDSQFTPELAEQSIAHLQRFTRKPITWLVITHPNPDKFNGASVFKDHGAKIIASAATAQAIPEVHNYKEYFFVEIAKMFAKGAYPQPVPVDKTFTGELDLVLRGGERIHLGELAEPGVSSTQTVAYIEGSGALVVGDLIHHKAHAWLEGGIVNGKPTPTIDRWVRDLRELSALYPKETTVYGGRGQSAPLDIAVADQIRYLQVAEQLVRKELRRLGDQAQEFHGPNAAPMYASLAARFQEAFPDYTLPYLIEYGAYGLVQHELSR